MTQISVVIPVKDGAATIRSQLDALSNQTEGTPPFEVIVADNGSVDGTQDVVSAYGERLDIRLIDASSVRGVSHARNEGVRHSRGRWILICDADDEVDPAWVRELSSALSLGADLVGGILDFRRLNERAVRRWRGGDCTGVMVHRDFLPFAHGACCGCSRSAFEAIGGFDESLLGGGDDIDFFWRGQLAGLALVEVPDAVVHYRLRDEVRAMRRQAFNYGAADPALYARHRANGMRRRSAAATAWTVIWFVSHSHWLLAGRSKRGAWTWDFYRQIGRITGSVRWRVWYP